VAPVVRRLPSCSHGSEKKPFKEAVGFLGRTKLAGHDCVRSLTEAAVALRAVYETEAEEMRFEVDYMKS
jgi:hypothetical protein